MSDLIAVAVLGSRMEAAVACNLLESHGIQAAVFADDAGGMYPPFGAGVRLMVRQEDAARARAILDAPPELENDAEGQPET